MILSCQNISKAFVENQVLKNVSFHIEDHEKAAIVGINGAGKTTYFNLLSGQLTATAGQVLSYNGDVVKTYYYSTSCGSTTDVTLWGNTTDNYPYFVAECVGGIDKGLTLTIESEFNTFIKSENEEGFIDSNKQEFDRDINGKKGEFGSTLTEE
jgi:ABC-type multidrug transport system ATPase subunit